MAIGARGATVPAEIGAIVPADGRGRPEGAQRREGDAGRPPRRDRPTRPRFDPPPELPQRPRPKRLKPGKAHRTAILADLPEEHRPIAEKALSGGIPGVRQAVNEQNASLRAEGKPEVPAAGLLKIAEELLPRLRVAEWLDRADAAKQDLAELDLRDLRSVVAAGEDPAVARDEATRAIAAELKEALAAKQETAIAEWLEDIQAALGVGRVIRALKLSAEPPKAGVRFPPEVGARLVAATIASLTADATADRWAAILEAVAFSPIRAAVTPAEAPAQVSPELTTTITRLAPLVPQIAALFGITPAPGAQTPKPLRPTRKSDPKKAGGSDRAGSTPSKAASPKPRPDAPAQEAPAADPAPAASEPEAATTEPEIATTEPEALATGEPEAATTEPEVATTEPEALAAEPEAATDRARSRHHRARGCDHRAEARHRRARGCDQRARSRTSQPSPKSPPPSPRHSPPASPRLRRPTTMPRRSAPRRSPGCPPGLGGRTRTPTIGPCPTSSCTRRAAASP